MNIHPMHRKEFDEIYMEYNITKESKWLEVPFVKQQLCRIESDGIEACIVWLFEWIRIALKHPKKKKTNNPENLCLVDQG